MAVIFSYGIDTMALHENIMSYSTQIGRRPSKYFQWYNIENPSDYHFPFTDSAEDGEEQTSIYYEIKKLVLKIREENDNSDCRIYGQIHRLEHDFTSDYKIKDDSPLRVYNFSFNEYLVVLVADFDNKSSFVGDYCYSRSTLQASVPIPELVIVNVGGELGYSVSYSRVPDEKQRPGWFTVSTEGAVDVGVEFAPGVSVNGSHMKGFGCLEWRVAPGAKTKWARLMSWAAVLLVY